MNNNDNKDDDKEIDIVDLRQLKRSIRGITENIDMYRYRTYDGEKGKDDDLFDV